MEQTELRLNRRNAIIGIGALGFGALAVREVNNLIKGNVETEDGIFIPIYEQNTQDLKVDQIPKDINIFFLGTASSLDSGKRLIPDEIQIRLSEQETSIMTGNTETPFIPISIAMRFGELATGSILVNHAVNHSRRKFLNTAAVTIGIWEILPSLALPVGLAGNLTMENQTARRIVARINALQENLHPEDLLIFFKSLIFAHKLLIAAEEFKREAGEKAKIAYQANGVYGSIEDFLAMGQEFTRELILAYPDMVLKEAARINGGVEGFCSVNFYKLPPHLDNLDPEEFEKIVLENTSVKNLVDQKLAQELLRRFKDLQ